MDASSFLKEHKELSQLKPADRHELADIQRRCLVLSGTASNKFSDGVIASSHLTNDLKNYFNTVGVYDDHLNAAMDQMKVSNNSFQWRSNIRPEQITQRIPKKNINVEREMQLFRKAFKQKPKPVADVKFSLASKGKAVVRKSAPKKEQEVSYPVFRTARDELSLQGVNKFAGGAVKVPHKKRLAIRGKFVPPMLSNGSEESAKSAEWSEEITDERLKNIDPKMVELIRSEIMDNGRTIDWKDIAGLEFAKNAIQEAVVWPMLRPDIFTGLRRPPKGILLFGPPGTGKTLIGKCVASQSKSTFFSISASSLTSKWVGDGEKMVRALFAVSRCHQPAVIFIDEIDSLLSQRSDTEHESSRRIKTEFLVQLDGATTDNEERLLLIGATNRPQELDEAARRRFVKRLYIPLPELNARLQLVKGLMTTEKNSLSEPHLMEIARLSDGFSGADIKNLCSDACLGPIRCISMSQIESIQATQVRPVTIDDFRKSLSRVRSSVAQKDLEQYIQWDSTYGSGSY